MDDYFIWWTSQADIEAFGEPNTYIFKTHTMPIYILEQVRSRYGRPSRGRLWVASGIPIESIEWDETKPAASS
jgi:hypothetical protein